MQPDHNFLTMTIPLAVTMMETTTVSLPEAATSIENMARMEVEEIAEMISVTVGIRWKRAVKVNIKAGREGKTPLPMSQ